MLFIVFENVMQVRTMQGHDSRRGEIIARIMIVTVRHTASVRPTSNQIHDYPFMIISEAIKITLNLISWLNSLQK